MKTPEKILIYRLGSLGDTIITLPCFHLIRKVYPRASMIILTNEPVSGKAAPAMAILENSGLCDEAVSYPVGTRKVSELGKVRHTLRQIQPDLFINLAAGRGRLKSLRDYLFFRSCRVGKIVGAPWRSQDLRVRQTADGWFEPESTRLASRLAALGTVDLSDRRFWDIGLTPAEKSQAAEWLPLGPQNYVAVSVGTKVPVKDWGEDNWEKFIAQLSARQPDTTLVFLGSADESARSEKLSRIWSGSTVNLCGKIAPRVSAAVLERCRLFVGHDSGPMHLAAVMGTPTIGLFSWFNPPGQWFPGHPSWSFLKIHYPALPAGGWTPGLQMKRSASEGILLLKPADILQSAMELLNSTNSKAAV